MIRYHRATGIRLPDGIPETHPDFVAAWAKCEAGTYHPPAKPGTVARGSLAAACIAFKGSAAIRGQSRSHRAALIRHTEAIMTDYGHVSLQSIKARHIAADLAKLAGTRPLARLNAWKRIMRHAVAIGLINDDPTATVKRPTLPKTSGYIVWSADDLARYRARWPISSVQRAGFELLLWTGARTVDAVKIGRQHIDRDGILTFRQSKTGGPAYIPWTAPLPAWAEAWADERRQMIEALQCLTGGLTFLHTAQNRPRTPQGLSRIISLAARAAGLTDRTAHGLRKARLTMIAEAGGSAHAIMAWGGHASLTEAQHYTQTADAKRLVTGAEQEQNSVSPASHDTKTAKN
ncbi:MAG: tyrosine-type recombinase/integrase [Paracoccus sp. (in: a-proteobacteria)]|uniref:tyrosine-type recombinase/integrase n=1 Tax=Paracoccus sp. TaxID=267 RepID=UPI0026DEC106|nr:tyrosine-type recombinase/integrase [Paracoccus sp. (in: a-proteobacteria)]MDO5621823.1 tyrosine-type recombinase/integrase [Paracoccus sp. (in: a-proteobacteria)]